MNFVMELPPSVVATMLASGQDSLAHRVLSECILPLYPSCGGVERAELLLELLFDAYRVGRVAKLSAEKMHRFLAIHVDLLSAMRRSVSGPELSSSDGAAMPRIATQSDASRAFDALMLHSALGPSADASGLAAISDGLAESPFSVDEVADLAGYVSSLYTEPVVYAAVRCVLCFFATVCACGMAFGGDFCLWAGWMKHFKLEHAPISANGELKCRRRR